MKIDRINIYQVKLEFRKPFTASWGSFKERFPTLVEIQSEGLSGWGEAAALPYPYYGHEDSYSVFHVLSKYICPLVAQVQPQGVEELNQLLSRIKLNNIAKSGLEMAFWDLIAKQQQQPLYKILGGVKTEIECGATLPSGKSAGEIIEAAQELRTKGYKKIRLKIDRSSRAEDLQQIFSIIGKQHLALDANGCFTPDDLPLLHDFDQLGALYFEQPFVAEDLLSHADLQKQINTPICLDECINSFYQAKIATTLKSARTFSIKSARMGGHSELLKVHELSINSGIGLVAGGMFESGIGRAHALAVASLAGCLLPAALGESQNYYTRDLVSPEFSFSKPGVIHLSDRAGIGVEIDREYIGQILVGSESFESLC